MGVNSHIKLCSYFHWTTIKYWSPDNVDLISFHGTLLFGNLIQSFDSRVNLQSHFIHNLYSSEGRGWRQVYSHAGEEEKQRSLESAIGRNGPQWEKRGMGYKRNWLQRGKKGMDYRGNGLQEEWATKREEGDGLQGERAMGEWATEGMGCRGLQGEWPIGGMGYWGNVLQGHDLQGK